MITHTDTTEETTYWWICLTCDYEWKAADPPCCPCCYSCQITSEEEE